MTTDHLLILSTQQPLTLWAFEDVEVIQYCAATPHFFISLFQAAKLVLNNSSPGFLKGFHCVSFYTD